MNKTNKHTLGMLLKNTLGKHYKTILQVLFTAVAMYFVFTKIPFQQVWKSLQSINISMFAVALLLFNISKFSNTLRMDLFYKELGIRLPILKQLKLYYVGMFYNLFLPGSIGGDGYKIYLLKDYKTTNAKELFKATLLDRLSGVSVLTWLACVFLVFSDIGTHFQYLNILGWLGIISILPTFYFISSYIFKPFKRILIPMLLYSFAVQLLQVICAICLLMALNIQTHYYDYLCFFLIGNAMTVIPISIGGVGIRELVILYGLQYLQINEDEAIAFTLLFFTVTAITSLLGFVFSFKLSKELQNISKN